MNKDTTTTQIALPESLRIHSGFDQNDELELHVSKDAIVISRAKMTAMQALNVMDLLQDFGDELHVALVETVGTCADCNEVAFNRLNVPEHLLKEVGIPKGSKLDAFADEVAGAIIITQGTPAHSLKDVPGFIMENLLEDDICLPELDYALKNEVIVYGN